MNVGESIGPYHVLEKLGEGGMGEVYRATDTALKRSVAIKVLPQAFSSDAERLARFQRKAEVLAALHHPSIAQIYGLEQHDGAMALVMELVEGPTLADRLGQGAMPVDEALAVAKQIVAALEVAHSIIHRDLKPSNIKLKPGAIDVADCAVKVLDFGLAKVLDPAAGASADASRSPTITTPVLTRAGVEPEGATGPPPRRATVPCSSGR